MAKVIKKKVKIPAGIKDENLSEMFNQMLGTGSVNMSIAYPRYIKIKGLVDQLIKLFDMFNKSPFMDKYTEFAEERAQITQFIDSAKQQRTELFKVDFSDYEWNLNLVEEPQKKTFAQVYEQVKKSELINKFIIMCDRLVPYKRSISDKSKLNSLFITSMAGVEFTPFPFTRLNLKYIFTLPSVQESTKHFFLIVMNKALELSYNLWSEITSPDINVDEFVDVIMANIKEIQKRPELSRCSLAFKKIEESVYLLKNRFNNYYRDFISTKNSTIMMEHFIIDVSNNTQADPQTMSQFRKIISFYRKIAQDQITNPKVKMLFDKVNESFRELERNTDNLTNIQKDLEEGDEDEEEDGDEEGKEEDEDAAAKAKKIIDSMAQLKIAQEVAQTKSVDELVAEIEGAGKNTKTKKR